VSLSGTGAKTAPGERETTRRAQAVAADPELSAWVAANAGTGKTHVLSRRVLRLLLAGTPPARLLCLTYTKAAAAEMARRVLDELARWVTADDAALGEHLLALLDRAASDEERVRARRLFALTIETPGGLKVQTVHGFCERVLQRFPLEAGVSPSFEVLDDDRRRRLVREATDHVLAAAARDRSGPLGSALGRLLVHAGDAALDGLLASALAETAWLEALERMPGGLEAASAALAESLALDPGISEACREAKLASVLPDADVQRLAVVFAESGAKTDLERGEKLASALASAGMRRVEVLREVFLTQQDQPRKSLATKAVRTAQPALVERLEEARDRFAVLWEQRKLAALHAATTALWSISAAVQQRCHEVKAASASLDFDDLVRLTAALLAGPSAAEWVLFKLDGGLDHILVDEAQDTSPLQWQVVEALAHEFFAGAGAREVVRSVFAVGDEKQSIYSFQGAAPHMFAATGARFEQAIRAAGARFERVALTTSFRSVPAVLETVDAVFADPDRTPGLTAGEAPVRHVARRSGQAGLVEFWEPIGPAPEAGEELWSPAEAALPRPPAEALAEAIAHTIRTWLDSGERLASTDRPVRPGDILVLVRRRQPFAAPMVAALERAGVPVAGADRLRLTASIAVEDVLAALRFALLPEDDLTLASVLKSPLIGFGDDDLLALATDRKGSLWHALGERAGSEPRYAEAVELLRRWRARADRSPPYEMIATMLDGDGMRARLLDRLGGEVAAPLEALLDAAVRDDAVAPPSLQGFLSRLQESQLEIRRDMEMGRDEVRVLTVHGAKGLEAPIVFLPDTCSAHPGGRPGGTLPAPGLAADAQGPAPVLWPIKGTSKLAVVAEARAERARREAEERNRLLYVALTRARDRLYIAGFHGAKGRGAGSWHAIVEAALGATLGEAQTREIGGVSLGIRRLEQAQRGPIEPRREGPVAPVGESGELPAWATSKATPEPRTLVPIVPSRLAPVHDEDGDPISTPAGSAAALPGAPSPLGPGRAVALARGTLTHQLLEHLPKLPADRRAAVGRAFLAERADLLAPAVRESILAEVTSILEHPTFGALFGASARAEVGIVAEIAPPAGIDAPPLRITGQIDRLLVESDRIVIVDFKTNRPPPLAAAAIPPAYMAQLAAYRLAVAGLYPDRPIVAAILWTDGARLVEVDNARLDRAERALWGDEC
jgi:ATP-dependent helicase/nuclease subunit A